MNLENLQIFGTLLAPQYADQHAQSVNEKFQQKCAYYCRFIEKKFAYILISFTFFMMPTHMYMVL